MNPTDVFHIDGDLPGEMDNPLIAGLTGGGFVIAWDRSLNSGIRSTHYRVYDASGNPVSNVQPFPPPKGNFQHVTDLIALPNGRFALSWFDYDTRNESSETGIFFQEFDSTGSSTTDVYRVLEQRVTFDNDQSGLLIGHLALDSNAGLTLSTNSEGDIVGYTPSSFFKSPAGESPIQTDALYSIDLSGGGKGEISQISPIIDTGTVDNSHAGLGGVALLGNDAGLAAYAVGANPTSVPAGIYARRIDDDGKPTSDVFLVAEQLRTVGFFNTRVTALSNENALITWADGSDSYGRILDISGNFVTDIFDLSGIGLGSGSRSHITVTAMPDGGFIISDGLNTTRYSSIGSAIKDDYGIFDGSNINDQIAASGILKDGSLVLVSTAQFEDFVDGEVIEDLFAKIVEPGMNSAIGNLFSAQSDTAQALSAAYELLLDGVPNEAGFAFLINGAVATNFGAGAGVTFNQENIFINLVNNLAQDNAEAKSKFDGIAVGTTLEAKVTSLYEAIIPLSMRSDAGLEFVTRPDGLKFYQDVAAERGVSGTDGAAIVALASLLKITVDGNFGVGNAVNDLIQAVAAGSAAIPASGTSLTPIEVADGTAFDGDDMSANAITLASTIILEEPSHKNVRFQPDESEVNDVEIIGNVENFGIFELG